MKAPPLRERAFFLESSPWAFFVAVAGFGHAGAVSAAGDAGTVMPDLLAALFLFRALRHESPAGWLFVPYLLWLLFATYLNGYVLVANGTGF